MKHHVEAVGRNFVLKVAVIASLLYGANGVVGRIEGRLLPVIESIQIKEITYRGGGWSEISGILTRLRECSFAGLRLEMTNASGSVMVDYQFLEPSKIRQHGPDQFGPWLVQFTEDQVEDMRAIALHRCHTGYLTETTVPFVR